MASNSSSSSSTTSISRDAAAAASAPTALSLAGGLQCRIGRARVAVPIEWVVRVIEYRVVSLPLGRSWIGGLGVHEGAPLLSVALVAPERRAAAPATTKGILLHVPGAAIAWALEIQEVFAFVRATVQPRRTEAAGERLPRWISGATTEEGRSIGWIHVGEMLAELERGGEAQP